MGLERFIVSKSYDFSSVVLTVSGLRIGGFAEDGGVTIAFDGDIASAKRGADGEATISKLPMPIAQLTITLMETSTSNGTLEGLLAAQRLLPTGFVLPIAMIDPSTGETFLAGQAAFSNMPEIGKAKEAGTREWRLLVPNAAVAYASA